MRTWFKKKKPHSTNEPVKSVDDWYKWLGDIRKSNVGDHSYFNAWTRAFSPIEIGALYVASKEAEKAKEFRKDDSTWEEQFEKEFVYGDGDREGMIPFISSLLADQKQRMLEMIDEIAEVPELAPGEYYTGTPPKIVYVGKLKSQLENL